MDLRETLIESSKKKGQGGWKGVAGSILLHGAAVGVILLASMNATEKVAADQTPIPVFVQQAAAPPPPPPPPPPPAGGAPAAQTPQVVKPVEPTPVKTPRPSFVAPQEIPEDIPEVKTITAPVSSLPTASAPGIASDAPAVAGGVVGGVAGGEAGGVLGGEIGGVTGGEIGGVVGGEIGGVKGGQLGGVVGGTPGGVVGGTPAPAPEAPSGPLRVGGGVKAPVLVRSVKPTYTEPARKARVTGVVIVEATIDRQGNVDRVKVIKGLPMGLSEQAADAVRKWKFRPGTMNGSPVDVYFNLTVVFTLGGDMPHVESARPAKRETKPEPAPPAAEPSAPMPEPPAEPSPEPEPAPVSEPPATELPTPPSN